MNVSRAQFLTTFTFSGSQALQSLPRGVPTSLAHWFTSVAREVLLSDRGVLDPWPKGLI